MRLALSRMKLRQILDKDKESIHGATDAQYKNHDKAKLWREFFESRALRSSEFPSTGFDNTTDLLIERNGSHCQ